MRKNVSIEKSVIYLITEGQAREENFAEKKKEILKAILTNYGH